MSYWTDAGRRCNTCYRLGRELRECARCIQEKACRKRGLNWFCQTCLRIEDLASGVVVGTRRLQGMDLGALIALHLTFRTRVDIWIIALTRYCYLLLVRIVFWRRFGVFAGLLPGAPARTFRFSHGARLLDARCLANHIVNIWGTGQWPRGTAPILLTGCDRDGFREVIERLSALPLRQRRRLTLCPFTLSEWCSTAGFTLQYFLHAPTAHGIQSCLLLRRVRAALSAAGVDHMGARQLTEDSAQGRAFRRMLFGD